VRLQDLRSRPDLNGATATIIAVDAERFSVVVDSTQEKIKVRARNTQAIQPDNQSDTRTTLFDHTLFVREGHFIQPSASCSSHTPGVNKASGRVSLPMPAGFWEVRLIEHDPDQHRLTVTLVATSADGGSMGEGEGKNADWDQLRGLVCTRTLQATDGEDVTLADVSVEDGLLVVQWSSTGVRTSNTSVDVPAPPSEAAASDVTEHAEAELDASEGSADLCDCEPTDDEEESSRARQDAWLDETWAIMGTKGESMAAKRTVPPRRLHKSPSPEGCHAPYKLPQRRSRRNASARRREVASQRACSSDTRSRVEPDWKMRQRQHAFEQVGEASPKSVLAV